MDEFVYKDQKRLRCGFTTGTCAAACTQAAMRQLLTGQTVSEVTVRLPESSRKLRFTKEAVGGRQPENTSETFGVKDVSGRGSSAAFPASDGGYCVQLSVYPTEDGGYGTRKDAGDDPDVTNGTEIRVVVAAADKAPEGAFVSNSGRLYLIGGRGVGRVTKPGLEQEIGQSAINRVPRQMIFAAAEEALSQYEELEEKQRYRITVSVPEGEVLAQRTFNPMLGIEGGISILGTTGIVEPMSEAAIVATIETSIRQALVMEETASAGPRRILAVPGNYGRRYAEEYLRLDPAGMVEVSNYIGEAIDLSISYGAAAFLLIGNVGKLVKLAAGIMNTHSRMADGRWEIFAAHLALCGGSRDEVQAIREAPTTEEMLTRLEEMGRRIPVMQSIMQSIEQHMAHRIGGKLRFGVLVYSERFGLVGSTEGAETLLSVFRKKKGECG